MKKVLIVLAVFGITGIVYANQSDSYDKTTDAQKIGWMDKGMVAVKNKLKDPSSAQFRGVYFNRGTDNVPMTCGEVNSKNSYGGYAGFQRFISAGRPDLTFLENQVGDFSTSWNRFCQ